MFGLSAALLAAVVALVYLAFRENLNLFYTPEVLAQKGPPKAGREVKVGGWVEPGSVTYLDEGVTIQFTIIDNSPHKIVVRYSDTKPDLFREGQGVVATGKFGPDGIFVAKPRTGLLAKHDENYQPRELKPLEAGG